MLGGPDRRTLFDVAAEWRAADGITNLGRLAAAGGARGRPAVSTRRSWSGFRHGARSGQEPQSAGVPEVPILGRAGYFMPTPISTSHGAS